MRVRAHRRFVNGSLFLLTAVWLTFTSTGCCGLGNCRDCVSGGWLNKSASTTKAVDSPQTLARSPASTRTSPGQNEFVSAKPVTEAATKPVTEASANSPAKEVASTESSSADKNSELAPRPPVEVMPNDAELAEKTTPKVKSVAPSAFTLANQIPTLTQKDENAQKKTTGPKEDDPVDNLRFVQELLTKSANFFENCPNYTCRLTRRERVGKSVLPEEIMLMNFRLKPRSVYYRWLTPDHAGRECVWVDGKFDGNMISLGGKSDPFLTGKQIKVDPEGMLARSKSKYPVTESGMDRMIARLRGIVEADVRGDSSRGKVIYAGLSHRDDHEGELIHLIQQIPMGTDPAFPKGGTRDWFFDPDTARLVIAEAVDLKGNFLEYYRYDRFIENASLTDSDFDPEVLWAKKPKKGNTEGEAWEAAKTTPELKR